MAARWLLGEATQGSTRPWGVVLVLGLTQIGWVFDHGSPSQPPELWGSPAHVFAALFTFLSALRLTREGRGGFLFTPPRGWVPPLFGVGLGLLLLGLIWNYIQNLQRLA
jgi:hypothetical protein